MIDTILLAPYYFSLKFRHFLYNRGIFRSRKADVPTICIGNVTVGGTGKTPHTEMTIRTILEEAAFNGKNIAVLSRGYRRKSKGFQQVMAGTDFALSGDEPLQIKNKFPGITVAVDNRRVEGCDFLSHPERLKTSKKGRKCRNKTMSPADLIILDDAFQHRALSPDLSILLIDWNRPVANDHLLPIGRLRDLKERVLDADVIIVSKCPSYLDEGQKDKWVRMLGLKGFDGDTMQGTNSKGKKQTLLFTSLRYGKPLPVFPEGDSRYIYSKRTILFTGIANDAPLRKYLSDSYRIVNHFSFGDHKKFTRQNISAISNAAAAMPIAVLLTTEKDSQRLAGRTDIPEELRKKIFYVPVEPAFSSEREKTIFTDCLKTTLNPLSR